MATSLSQKKKDVKRQSFRTDCCDFTEKFLSTVFDKKNDRKLKVNQKSENWQCEMKVRRMGITEIR